MLKIAALPSEWDHAVAPDGRQYAQQSSLRRRLPRYPSRTLQAVDTARQQRDVLAVLPELDRGG